MAVLKKDGRFLASSIDPVREARAWADRVVAELSPGQTVIVLGLGSGYHAQALSESGVTFVVIEPDAEVITAVAEIFPRIRAIHEPIWNELISHDSFREAVGGLFLVAPHGPSLQGEREYYARVEALLLGRDQLSFLLLLKTRPELLALLEPKALADVSKTEAVSVKTLARLFSAKSLPSRERRLWRILEELVL